MEDIRLSTPTFVCTAHRTHRSPRLLLFVVDEGKQVVVKNSFRLCGLYSSVVKLLQSPTLETKKKLVSTWKCDMDRRVVLTFKAFL